MSFNFLDGVMIAPLTVSAVAVTLAVLLLAVFLDNGKKGIDTKCIAFAGISVALSVGLSFVRLFSLPQGGSVTLASILPLLLFGFVYGTKKGVLVGIVLGLLSFIIEPFAVHPAQVILDYFVAYGAMGLVGVTAKIKPLRKYPQIEFAVGAILACTLRFVSHVLSGVFAFETPIVGSIAYNSFVFVDLSIAVVVGVLVLSSKPLYNLIANKKNESEK